jgi:tRNA modification GTPase
MRRARDAIARADHVLYVVDAAADPDAYSFAEECDTLPEGLPVTLVMNKSDIAVGVEDADRVSAETYKMASPRIAISASTGAGIDALRQRMAAVGHTEAAGGSFSARARHVEALERAPRQLDAACMHLAAKQGELAAFELRSAQASLGEVIGDVTSDELLGHIFRSFCIGK